jgi:hypothetical protein
MMGTELAGVIADHIAAVNLFDTDAVAATFVFRASKPSRSPFRPDLRRRRQ